MSKRSAAIPFATLALDHTSPAPLYRQLYDELRRAILNGRLAPGVRLPSTRELAVELGVSRNTVRLASGFAVSSVMRIPASGKADC